MAITTLNNRSINRSDTAASGQLWTATSATASDFQAAASSAKVGQILQTVNTGTETAGVSTYTDITDFARTITCTATSSKVLILVDMKFCIQSGYRGWYQLMRDTTAIYVSDAMAATGGGTHSGNENMYGETIMYLDSPSSTSEISYNLEWKTQSAASMHLNRTHANNTTFGGNGASSITVMEILA